MATLSIKFQDLKDGKVKVALDPLSAVQKLRKHPEKATAAQRTALYAYVAINEAEKLKAARVEVGIS